MRRGWLGASLLATTLTAAACGAGRGPETAASSAAPSAATASAPPAPAPAEYVGSARCGACHRENHDRWEHDWHARALSPPTTATVAAPWNGVHFRGESSEAWMTRTRDGYVVRTRDRAGVLGDYPVAWVIGGKRMQDPLTIFPDGRWQVLPVYYHVTGRRWVDYNEEKQGRVDPDHPFFWTNFRRNANHECLDCHTTGLDVRYDAASHVWTTRFADAGVACEDCHGPGSRHAASKDPRDIVQPRKQEPDVEMAICAQCHGPRNPLFPLLDREHRFRPGQRYDDHYDAYVITAGPGDRSGDFFADGRPKSGSFEYQALLQSACHRKGGATCLSCHTAPHEEHGRNELQPADAGEVLEDHSCRQCHPAEMDGAAAHSHHRARAAQSCVACHMPRVIPAVLDHEADHALDVPNPENTRRHGVPNACNACHATKTPQAMADALRRWWPGAVQRQRRRLRLADAFDLETTPATGPALAAVAKDTDEAPTLRGAAAVLLPQYDPAAAVTLRPLVKDASPIVRAKAVTALAASGARDASGEIAALTRDPSIAVRQAAALALADLGAPGAETALRALTTDPATEGLTQPHVRLALLVGRAGDFAGATRELERAATLRPYNAASHIMLSDAYGRLGRVAEARREAEEALRFDPGSQAARQRLEHFSR